MNNEKRDLLKRHLRETKAKSKSKSFSDLVARMRAEQEFRRILDGLKKKMHSQEILPFLTPERDETEYPPDFIIWKDEFRLPVYLVETTDKDEHLLSRSKASDILNYLNRTDLTDVVIAWMVPPEFPSVSLKVDELEKRAEIGEKAVIFEGEKAFEEIIIDSLSTKIASWPVPKFEEIPQMKGPESLLETFDLMFRKAFRKELRKRRPHLPHRKKALQDINEEELEKICLIFKEYFKEELMPEDFVNSLRALAKISNKSSGEK